MKKTLTALTLFAMLPASIVLADSDDCSVPRAQRQPPEAVFQLAEQNGWIIRDFEVDDGCYAIEGRDRDGKRIEAELDPATLAVISMEYEDEDDSYGAGNNPVAAGTVAPPQNGLFSNAAAPKVKIN